MGINNSGEQFPYTNFHDLNLDWIVKITKDFLDQYTHIQEVIESGLTDLGNLIDSGLDQLQNKADTLSALLQAWYDTHSADIANQLAEALADLNAWYNTHYMDLSNQLTTALQTFNNSAETKSQELLDSWPSDYSEVVTRLDNIRILLNSNIANFNIPNLLSFWNDASATVEGITFSRNADGSYDVTGTASSNSYTSFFASNNSLPAGLKAGGLYHVVYESDVGNNSNVDFRIWSWNGNAINGIANIYADADTMIQLPSDLEGIIIRLFVDSGKTCNETVKIGFYSYEDEQNTIKPLIDKKWITPESEIDLYPFLNHSASIVSGTVTFTMKPDESYDVVGSASSTQFARLWSETNKLPTGIEPGKSYIIKYTSDNVSFEIYDFTGGNVNRLVTTKTNNMVHIPSTCTGLLIRLVVWGGDSANENVRPRIYTVSGINKSVVWDYSTITTCDNAKRNSIILCSNVADFPSSDHNGILETISYETEWAVQIAFPYLESDNLKYRGRLVNGTWTSWKTAGEGGSTTTITREVSNDTYNNTYNITATPNITTDSNGWLQSVDTDTADESGKTDMTSAIMTMLTQTGYCHLSPGIFYVSGNIDIPDGATLEGCGNDTIIRLLSSVSNGYILGIKHYCTIKNLRLSGSRNTITIGSNIGGKIGINYKRNPLAPESRYTCEITQCWIENLDSGIYCNNTGGGLLNGLIVTDTVIQHCNAGINIDFFSEYNKFSNITIFDCWFACINNGGNNTFVSCTFHGVVGFTIDDSAGDKNNNAHGTCVGCVFNHIDNHNHPETLGGGKALNIVGADNGFIFSDCQLWYGSVYIENSPAIILSNCLLGGSPKIEIVGGSSSLFVNGCVFMQNPTIINSGILRLNNSYLPNGTLITQ